MNLHNLYTRRQADRRVLGMAAVLYPYTAAGDFAEDAYVTCLRDTVAAGLTPAVNMDTGYVNLLTKEEQERVLELTHSVVQGKPFVAGAYIEGDNGDVIDLYRREMATIVEHGGTPILFQTSRLHGASTMQIAEIYRRAASGFETVYAFELGKMFAPCGTIWPLDTVKAIMEIPEIKGIKHSSLDRLQEIERLEMRDRVRPEFRILTGNDLGIDMIEYGSDYLLGLAAFSPAKFAERDQLWEASDPAYLALADSLQYLGNVAFRPPVAAYKHSAASFLRLLGKIPSDRTHPESPKRPAWEAEMMRHCAVRLGLLGGL